MATLTETELLILNSIIYADSFSNYFSKNRNGSIYKWALQFDLSTIDDANKPAEISREEFATIIATILKNPEVYNQIKVRNIETEIANPHGAQNQLVVNATLSYDDSLVVLYKGTGGDMEWRDNGEGAYSDKTDTTQQLKALDYFDRMVARFGKDKRIYTSGHSKGANKAMYVAILRGMLVEHAYAYDGQGFGQAFWKKYAEAIELYKHKITNISHQYDFVNILLFSVAGDNRYIVSQQLENTKINAALLKEIITAWHSPYSLFALESNELVLNEYGEQSKIMRELQGLVEHYMKYMDEEDLRFLIDMIMNAFIKEHSEAYGEINEMPEGFLERLLGLTKGYAEDHKHLDFETIMQPIATFLKGLDMPSTDMMIGNYAGSLFNFMITKLLQPKYEQIETEIYAPRVRDFSDTVKQQLLDLVEERNAEPWCDIRRWDSFHQVEPLFAKDLDLWGQAEELQRYYREIMTVQSVSREQIHQIFVQVYEKDARFANELNEVNQVILDINRKLATINDSFKL